jgi:hypothetical protein
MWFVFFELIVYWAAGSISVDVYWAAGSISLDVYWDFPKF